MSAFLMAMAFVAQGADSDSKDLGDFLGWHSWQSGTSCNTMRVFERDTVFIVKRDFADPKTVVTAVSNPNWSVVQGKEYSHIKYDFGGGNYWFDAPTIGSVSGQIHGLFSYWKQAFLSDLRRATAVEITQDKRFIDRLSLDGLSYAVSTIERCISRMEAAKAEADRKKTIDAFPIDPFANDSKEKK